MPLRPEEIVDSKNRSYFSLRTDAKYIEHFTLQSAIQATDLIAVSIYRNSYELLGFSNDYFRFEIFNINGDKIQEVEMNGWKLKFGGPIMDKDRFNQYRTFTCSIASPSDPEQFTHVENLYIGIEDFAKVVKRIKAFSERNTISLPSALWEIEVLREKSNDLEKKSEEIWQNNQKLLAQLKDCKSKIS